MNLRTCFGILLILHSFLLSAQLKDRAAWVNPFIGTGGHGHTFPGPTTPFGMVQLSPDTRNDNSWDACGGYYYTDTFLLGFSHTHLSGTGVSDLGDILFQPLNTPVFHPDQYKQRFSHASEIAEAGYYRVVLQETETKVELTASEYAGFQKYTFANAKDQWVLVDLEHRDQLLSHSLDLQNGNLFLKGHRQSKAWADNQWVFFETEFSRPVIKYIYNESKTKVALYFGNSSEPLFLKTILSFTGFDGVAVNKKYTNEWLKHGADKKREASVINIQSASQEQFDLCRSRTRDLWNAEFEHIQVDEVEFAKEKSIAAIHDSVLTIFYTAFYHCLIHPSLASDADGTYRGRDQQLHKADHRVYHVFSLWDTYRTLHPLLTLTHRIRTREFVLSMLLQFKDGGRLPVWELGSSETDCMIGYHSVPVILEALQKGILTERDTSYIMQAIQFSSNRKEPAYQYQIPIASELLTLYNAPLGYIDVLREAESVSKTLEYAFDDWCIAQIIQIIQPDSLNLINQYLTRSKRYAHLFDPETKTMRPKRNGQFLTPYKPGEVNNHYTEANAWQYSFYVPHDLQGLIGLMGGVNGFRQQLDSLFFGTEQLSGREQADISGLIGQYAHGNEPSHHMAYLYNYANVSDTTQMLIKHIMNDFYTNRPDGLIGNEDCGQMSAWYVMSALGFYPVAPGNNQYATGTPLFPRVLVVNERNDSLIITRPIGNRGTLTISGSSFLNRAKKTQTSLVGVVNPNLYYTEITYDWLIQARGLDFSSQQKPAKIAHEKTSSQQDVQLKRVDISAKELVNKGESYQVQFKKFGSLTDTLHVFIRYMDSPFVSHPKFKAQIIHRYLITTDEVFMITLRGAALVWACVGDVDQASFTATLINERPNQYEVKSIKGQFNVQYSAGGAGGLVDGVLGTAQWRSGGWQGYQNQDFEAVIDLKETTTINYLGARFLTDERSWIFLPRTLKFEYSLDGLTYQAFNDHIFDASIRYPESIVVPLIVGYKPPKTVKRKANLSVQARYIRVKATNFGKLPVGHPGHAFNGDAFIFIDEILVNPPVHSED